MKLFPTRTARNTFFILVLTFILGSAFFIFIGRSLHSLEQHRFIEQSRNNQIIKIVNVAHHIPDTELKRYLSSVKNPMFHLWLGKNPLKHANQFKKTNAYEMHMFFKTHPDIQYLSFQLPNNQWLNIRVQTFRRINPMLVFIVISSVIVTFLLLFIFAWSVKRLSAPFSQFAVAAKKFGLDLNAAPLAETGPPELREVIQAFNEMQGRIRRLMSDRTQMLAAISHDLRTPITRLKLRAELLQDPTRVKNIIEDLNEMETMISAILVFTKEDYQDEPMEHFDINALIESICDEMSDTGFPVELNALNKRVPFFGRMHTLKRTFSNLLDNAIKYGKTAHVQLALKDDKVIVTIDDEGPGIPSSEMMKVFDPFYRLEQSRSKKTGGTGLGLAIARDVIRAHGGDIVLSNLPQGGLRATVTLSIKVINEL